MIKYLGSKRTLVPTIAGIVDALPNIATVCDLFTGTTRVAQELKRRGYYVTANDTATYSYQLALAYIQADINLIDRPRIERLLSELEALPGRRGYYTIEYSEQARYFQPKNGRRIDAIRDAIDELQLTPEERAILLTSLMLGADRVDSTTGVQMAYLKAWAKRSHNDLELRMPDLLPGPGRATQLDAVAFVERGGTDGLDLTYVDPPYNQHSYFANYHIFESLVRHDQPETYGVARKRIDTRSSENKSQFNFTRAFLPTFQRLVAGIQSRFILVSFNSEGFLSENQLMDVLSHRGYVQKISVDFKRYVGAQIGIYNPSGEKVGKVSHLRNQEHLFLVGNEADVRRAMKTGPVHTEQQMALFA